MPFLHTKKLSIFMQKKIDKVSMHLLKKSKGGTKYILRQL